MQNGIEQEFKTDAATSMWVWPGRTTIAHNGLNPGRRIQLRNKDFNVIANDLDVSYEKASTFYFPRNHKVLYKNDLLTYQLIGTTPDIQPIENEYVSEGRYINETDIRENAKVAVISNKIKNEVFANMESPLGEYLNISGAGFKIVGVFGEVGNEEGEEERIFIPLSTAQLTFNGGDKISNLTYMLPEKKSLDANVAASEEFVSEIKAYLNQAHGVAPEDERAIHVWNPIEQAKRYYALTGNMKFSFGL